jgi:hypothetical protein
MPFCSNCGVPMRDGAAFCSRCGAGMVAKAAAMDSSRKPRRGTLTGFVGAIVSLIVLLIIIAALFGPNQQSGGDAPTGDSVTPPKPDFIVSAPDLCREYVANSIAADLKYKGKTLEVSGTIKDINKDILNTIYVVLSSDDPESITDAQLYFSDAHEREAAALNKGNYFSAICRCDGKFMNVLLKDCEITASGLH